jgi:hypothetical protein
MANPHNYDNLPVCPHCNRRVALVHNGVCTSLGCGKKLSDPVFYPRHQPTQLELDFVGKSSLPEQEFKHAA